MRDFGRDWRRWSAAERVSAVLIALVSFGAFAAMFITATPS
jgi:hypothetical protein